ncbi:MAG: methyltransferase domain-containing protein [Alphaproteobacteria bacterium]|nr:MAG: methyltransferase domain-containing protein [Alphaproteobacteria bacterium]
MTSPHRCRSCGGTCTETFVDLGVMPSANAYVPVERADVPDRAFPLRTVVCDVCRLVQVDYDMPPADLFSDYAYFSSYSTSWVEHARRYVEAVIPRLGLSSSSLVVEIASNDGYLLQHFLPHGIPVLGIEPAANVAAVAEQKGVPTDVAFFGRDTARRLVAEGRAADLLLGNNVLAHVPDLNDFLGGVAIALKDASSVFTFEFPHLLRLIEDVQFDTIYHEHFSYLSLAALEPALARHGLGLFDVERLPTHGGSLRVWGRKGGAGTSPGLVAVRGDEAAAGLHHSEVYHSFGHRVAHCRHALMEFLADARRAGKSVVGYGAAAKGNTLLNFCGVTADDVAYVVDRNPVKQNTLLPGSRIPVFAPERVMETRPDYLLILPWNLKAEIMDQMSGIRAWGGQFVTPVPTVAVHP